MRYPIIRYLEPCEIPLASGTLKHREGLLLTGPQGNQVECAPLPGFSTETVEECMTWLDHPCNATPPPPALAYAMSYLNSDIAPTNQKIKTNGLVTSRSIEPNWQEREVWKIKIGKNPVEDACYLNHIPPQVRLRLDANRQYTADEYLQFCQHLKYLHRIEYVEEPTHEPIPKEGGLPIALDETLWKKDRPDWKHTPHLKALVLKPTLIGSLEALNQIIETARSSNLTITMSSCYESDIGISMLRNLIHHWGLTETVHGLDASIPTPQRRYIPCPMRNTALDQRIREAERIIQKNTDPTIAIHAKPSSAWLPWIWAIWRQKKTLFPINHRFSETHAKELGHRARTTTLLTEPPTIPAETTIQETEPSIPYLELDQRATLVATSGSTGKEKLVCHTIKAHYYSALGFLQRYPMEPTDRWWLSLGWNHVAGLGILWRCALAGAAIQFRRENYTHCSLVNAQLSTWKPSKDFKMGLVGGGPVPQVLPPKLYSTYGMTETASQVCTDGKVLPYREVCIQNGEICVRGPILMQGYLQADGSTVCPLDEEGWFHTGDLGEWTSEKALRVMGRKDRMFISGGENIYPEEIERVLEQLFPHIRMAVVPATNACYGQRPVLFAHVRDCADFQIQMRKSLENYGRLPKFKWPDQVLPMPSEALEGLKVRYGVLKQVLASEFPE